MTSPRRIVVAEKHAVKDLHIDPRVQRDIIPTWVKKLADDLRPEAIGTLVVSKRKLPSGKAKLVVLDGQHRLQALRDLGMTDHEVMCEVHLGLDLAGEAGLFRRKNKHRLVGPYDDYVKGVTEQEPECMAIHKVLTERGLKVTQQTAPGSVRAITAVREVYRSGEDNLAATLDILTAAYGTTIDAMEGSLIQGVGVLVNRYNGELDRAALIRKLAKRPGGPLKLLGDARGAKDLFGTTVPRCVAMVARETYNRGRNAGKLPPL